MYRLFVLLSATTISMSRSLSRQWNLQVVKTRPTTYEIVTCVFVVSLVGPPDSIQSLVHVQDEDVASPAVQVSTTGICFD